METSYFRRGVLLDVGLGVFLFLISVFSYLLINWQFALMSGAVLVPIALGLILRAIAKIIYGSEWDSRERMSFFGIVYGVLTAAGFCLVLWKATGLMGSNEFERWVLRIGGPGVLGWLFGRSIVSIFVFQKKFGGIHKKNLKKVLNIKKSKNGGGV